MEEKAFQYSEEIKNLQHSVEQKRKVCFGLYPWTPSGKTQFSLLDESEPSVSTQRKRPYRK